MTTRPQDTAQAIRALKTIMLPARIERTCVRCDLSIDAESSEKLVYSEEWLSEEDLRRHIRSEHFVQMLIVMEMADQPPELEFAFISETRGLDFVEAVKRQG